MAGSKMDNGIRLEIPKRTPTANFWSHKHWSRYRKVRKEWNMLIWVAASQAKVYGRPSLKKCRLEIERHSPKVMWIKDYDNLVGGCKPVIDALTENGLISDDSIDVIGIPMITQHLCGREEERTVIRLVIGHHQTDQH